MGDTEVETGRAVARVGIGRRGDGAGSAIIVADATVVSVQVGTLGQVVVQTQTPLDGIGIVNFLVLDAANHGLQGELANRSRGADQPVR